MSTAAETRERLLLHGRAAFAAKGHDGVSLHRDVLAPAGVSNGSFYHQFSDKTDLLVAILEDAAARGRFFMAEAAATRSDQTREQQLVAGMTLWLELAEVGEDIIRIQFRERNNADPRVRKLVADVNQRASAALAERIAEARDSQERQPADDLDPHIAARLIRALTTGVVMDYLDMPKRKRNAERDALARAMAAFIGGGLHALATTETKATTS